MPSMDGEMSSVDVVHGWRNVIHGWRNVITTDDGHGRNINKFHQSNLLSSIYDKLGI